MYRQKPKTSKRIPRGHRNDPPQVRLSKSLSWLLRHGANKKGLEILPDGYVRVSDVLALPTFEKEKVTLPQLQELVEKDQKGRFDLILAPQSPPGCGSWLIRANQGHSIRDIELALTPILCASDIPMAVHGTTRQAWDSIATQGLSRMERNHIHLAQGVPGSGVRSGMRASSQILIYVDVQKAIYAGFKFWLSNNGVVLTEGDSNGFLAPEFFQRVENADHTPAPGWKGKYISDDPSEVPSFTHSDV